MKPEAAYRGLLSLEALEAVSKTLAPGTRKASALRTLSLIEKQDTALLRPFWDWAAREAKLPKLNMSSKPLEAIKEPWRESKPFVSVASYHETFGASTFLDIFHHAPLDMKSETVALGLQSVPRFEDSVVDGEGVPVLRGNYSTNYNNQTILQEEMRWNCHIDEAIYMAAHDSSMNECRDHDSES